MNILINEFGLFCPIGRESWPRSATYCCIDSSGLISFHSSEPKYSAIFGGWQGVPIEERKSKHKGGERYIWGKYFNKNL